MANTINKASNAALHTTVQNYYDGKLLMEMEKRLVYYQGGQRRSLPKGSGRVAEFWRYEPFDAVTTALTEGVVPDGQTLSMSKVTAEVKAYGGYVATTDVLDLTGVNTQTNQLVHLMARQGALSVDHIVRDVIFGGTNAMYCGKKAARDAVTAADKLTVEDIRRAVRKLEKASQSATVTEIGTTISSSARQRRSRGWATRCGRTRANISRRSRSKTVRSASCSA